MCFSRFILFILLMSFIKKTLSRSSTYLQNPLESAECLIIPGQNGEDIALIPIGCIDGSILYLESHDLPESEVGMQEQEHHFGGSKGSGECRGV